MHMLNIFHVLLVILLFEIIRFSNGIEIFAKLKPKQVKCIRERINKDTLVVGKFKSEDSADVFSVHIFDIDVNEIEFLSYRKNPIYESLNKNDIKTAFNTYYASSYSFCVHNNVSGHDMAIHFEIKYGTEAKDYAQIAKTEHLNEATVYVKQIIDQMNNFHKNLIRIKTLEEEERKSADKLNDLLMWFSIVTTAIIILTAIIQDFYFKKFFTSKKII